MLHHLIHNKYTKAAKSVAKLGHYTVKTAVSMARDIIKPKVKGKKR